MSRFHVLISAKRSPPHCGSTASSSRQSSGSLASSEGDNLKQITDELQAGFNGPGQEHGHVMHEIIRIAWVTAECRFYIDAFPNRLGEPTITPSSR